MTDPAAPPLPPAEPVHDPVPAPRAEAISAFVAQNANAERPSGLFGLWTDNVGGETIGRALTGDSELGALTPAERDLLAREATQVWQTGRNDEAAHEAVTAVANDPQARRSLATAFAAPLAEAERHFATGGTYLEQEGASAFRHTLAGHAMGLSGADTIAAFQGVESRLGQIAAQGDEGARLALFDAVASGQVTPAAGDAFMTAAFLHGDRGIADGEAERASFARALAEVTNTDESPYRAQTTAALADRLTGVLATDGGRDLLMNQEIVPEQRAWALAQVAQNPALTGEALQDGWASPAISEAYAEAAVARFAARGTAPETLTGEALRNSIGQSMGITPDQLPGSGETPAAAEARLNAGMAHRYYGENAAIDAVAARITALGGDAPQVSIVPVTVTSNDFGAAVIPVYRVETANGPKIVDHQGLEYDSVAEWAAENRLPDGQMTYPAGLDLRSRETVTGNTPGVNDTFWEHTQEVGNWVALGAGIVAGGIAIAATGGLATPGVLAAGTALGGGAALWGAGQSGAALAELHDRGVDLTDMSNPEVRGHVIEFAANTLSLGAMAGAARLASLGDDAIRAAGQGGALRTVAGLQMTAEAADVVALGDQAIQLQQNWDRMDAGQRAAGLLNVAFWGGMTAATAGAGGAPVTDGASFTRLQNHMAFGTPYPVQADAGLDPGQIRVTYDPANPRPDSIRITHGPNPDPAALALHVDAARRMDRAMGLETRLAQMLDGRTPEPGSQAWEARQEIAKIRDEAAIQLRRLSDPTLDPTARAEVQTRLRELDQATVREERNLTNAAQGDGFVEAPRSLTDLLTQHAATGAIRRDLPDGVTAPDVPAADAAAAVDYGTLNTNGQALGISATITRDSLNTGSHADGDIRPPGFPAEGTGRHDFGRGHLLARRLGGSGEVPENLVTLFQNPANTPVMSDFEAAVYRAVDAGEVINYQVTPVYDGAGRPTELAISARGSDGFELDITLINRGR